MAPVKKPKFSYCHEDMLKAVEEVKGGANASAVSRKYGIPRTTITAKVSGKHPLQRKMGPTPRLGTEAEQLLVKWIMGLACRGFPITKYNLLTSVQQIAQGLGQSSAFPNGKPGKKWLQLFLQRNPEIAERTPEKLSKVRAVVTKENVESWFSEVMTYCTENGYESILNDPSRLFNADESNFVLCPKGEKVLGIKGQKNIYEVHSGNDKEGLTVLTNINAAGTIAPTLVIYPGQRLPQAIKLSVPSDWSIARSDKGWMTAENFFEYFVNIFFPWIKEQGIKLPIIMFLDGHSSHLSYHLSKFCSQNEIILIALLPNTTHCMQPLDVSVFGPLKKKWAQSVQDWRLNMNGERLTKYNFAPMLKCIMSKTIKKETVVNGFRVCGLYPFDSRNVDYSKLDVLGSKIVQKQAKGITMETIRTTTSNEASTRSATESHPGIDSQWLFALENLINQESLLKFRETYNRITPVWDGEECAHDLYVLWKKAKDRLESCSLQEPTPAELVIEDDSEKQELTSLPEAVAHCSKEVSPVAHCSKELVSADTEDAMHKIAVNSPEQQTKLVQVISPGRKVPTPIKKYCFWPGTPPKKKSNTRLAKVRLPSVLSSKVWIEMEGKKRETKAKELKEKEERKRKREEKRKENPKTKKRSKKTIIFDEEEDWKCKICQKRYSAELITTQRRRWIECDDCKQAYHYKCIPKKHLDAFGLDEQDDDEDELAFICHLCANDIDSDCEPLQFEDDDDELDEDDS